MDVYWSVIESPYIPFINYSDPVPVLKDINHAIPADASKIKLMNCPAFTDLCKNTYALHIPMDYEISYKDSQATADMYDPGYFNRMVQIRDNRFSRLTSVDFKYVFFSEKQLIAEILPCFLTSNGFTDNADLIPGQMDIGKWIRPVECAYIAKSGDRTVKFHMGDAFAFIRFHTDEKIRLRKFYWSQNLDYMVNNNLRSRMYKPRFNNLQYFYRLFQQSRMRSIVLREIKQNLL